MGCTPQLQNRARERNNLRMRMGNFTKTSRDARSGIGEWKLEKYKWLDKKQITAVWKGKRL